MEQKYIVQRDTLIDLLASAATDYVIGRVTEKELQTIARIITEQLARLQRPTALLHNNRGGLTYDISTHPKGD